MELASLFISGIIMMLCSFFNLFCSFPPKIKQKHPTTYIILLAIIASIVFFLETANIIIWWPQAEKIIISMIINIIADVVALIAIVYLVKNAIILIKARKQ